MIYLVSKFPCVIGGKENFKIDKNVRYCVENVDNTPQIVYPMDKSLPFSISFMDILNSLPHENASKVEIGHNQYIFLNANRYLTPSFTEFKYLNFDVNVTLSQTLNIQVNGETLCNNDVENIAYSHFEVFNSYCVIFFEGKRNYFVIIDGKNLKCSDYYDEVRYIKNKTYEEYNVYLDNEEINISNKLKHLVFLDCLKVGNLNYCNSMLSDSIKQEDSKNIKNFFPEFDDYYPFEDNTVVLFKKNALSGKFKFDINLDKIENIIHLD